MIGGWFYRIFTFRNNHQLDTTLWFNYSETTVENKSELSASTTEYLENIRPKKYVKFLNVYKMPNTTIGFNINYFYQTKSNDITKFDFMVTADLNIDYKLTKNINLSVGGFNIFDKVPNKWDRSNKYFGYDGIMPYSQQTPVDYSGAYYYLSLKYQF